MLLESPREFFRGGHSELDALVLRAESDSAWHLIDPQFAVAVPQPHRLQIPLGYAMPHGDPDFLQLLNRWILLKQSDLTIGRLFEYWFEGVEAPAAREPRCSVLRNVLGRKAPRRESKAAS